MKRKSKKKSYAYIYWIVFGLIVLGIGYYGYTQNWQDYWAFENIKTNIGILFPGLFGLNSNNTIIIYENSGSSSGSTPLTCSQIAAKNGALYVEGISSGSQCLTQTKVECEQIGKTLEGYGFTENCCYYNCMDKPIEAPQATCTDSDGGQDDQQFIKGTVTSSVGTFIDQCDWNNGGLTEYYCDGTTPKQTNIVCENYWSCQEGKCAQQMCEDIMNPTPEKCASGYAPEGSTCGYWDINGGQCLLSY